MTTNTAPSTPTDPGSSTTPPAATTSPPPSPPPAKTPLTRDLDDVAMEALESASSKVSAEWMETRDYLRVQIMMGTFNNVPDVYKRRNWVFATCGLKTDPKAQSRVEDLVKNKGYYLAPPGVRAVGFEKHGDNVFIVCCSPETARNVIADKAMRGAVRRERLRKTSIAEIEQRLRDGLPKGTDISFAPVIGHGNASAFDREIAAVRRAVAR